MFRFLPLIALVFAGCIHWSGNRGLSSLPDESALSALVQNKKFNKELCQPLADKISEMNTNGFAIEVGGNRLWEYYDQDHSAETPHVLWSASKTLTTTLIGAAIHEGKKIGGKKLTLDRPVSELLADMDKGRLRKVNDNNTQILNAYKRKYGDNASRQLATDLTAMNRVDRRAKLAHLVSMTYPFKWNEFYESDITNSTFIPMLYLEGRYNMAEYAFSQPYDTVKTGGDSIPPGGKTIYSGGSSNLLQHILRKTYGEQEYASLPWEKLFRPLGVDLSKARWERDESGLFVGSSYAYLTPRDMLKYGRFYIDCANPAKEDCKGIISPEWAREAMTLEPSLGSKHTPEEYARNLGVQSKRVFWLNQPIYVDNDPTKKRIYPEEGSPDDREFPNAPADMVFAAGHYGQLIIMIPSQDMVISRVGHDLQYWGEIDTLVKSTIDCFTN